jgi:reactive intermediate/imine deaminase
MEHFPHPAGLAPPNGYSHAVTFEGRMVAVSGQVPVDRDGTVVGAGDAAAQTRQVFTNLGTALAAAGARLDQIVKLTVFLTDLGDLPAFRTVRDEFLDPERPPACSLVQVSGLVNPAFRIEVDALAAI